MEKDYEAEKTKREERFELAEQLFFLPSNKLEVYKLIGGINRARIQIYKGLSKFRHERNHKKMIETTVNEFDAVKQKTTANTVYKQ